MASDVLREIDRLIDMAARSDGNENEARNAAVKACRLIRLHDLRIVAEPVRRTRSVEEVGGRDRSQAIEDVTRVADGATRIASAVGDIADIFSRRRRGRR